MKYQQLKILIHTQLYIFEQDKFLSWEGIKGWVKK